MKLMIENLLFTLTETGMSIKKEDSAEFITLTENESLSMVEGIISMHEAVIKSQKDGVDNE